MGKMKLSFKALVFAGTVLTASAASAQQRMVEDYVRAPSLAWAT